MSEQVPIPIKAYLMLLEKEQNLQNITDDELKRKTRVAQT
jgi:hypothetical protein